MHRGGRAIARIDQGLRTLFSFDQNHLLGMGNTGLIEQRPRIGRRHLAALGIPWPKLLATGSGFVPIHAGNQTAVGGQVVPFGGGGPQLIHRCAGLAFDGRHGRRAAEDFAGEAQHRSEIAMGIPMAVRGNQRKDVTPIARGAIDPQTRTLTVEFNFQAASRAAQHIANHEFAVHDLASRKQGKQHTLQSSQQSGAQLVPLGIATRRRTHIVLTIEIKHGHPLRRYLLDSGSPLWSRSRA